MTDATMTDCVNFDQKPKESIRDQILNKVSLEVGYGPDLIIDEDDWAKLNKLP